MNWFKNIISSKKNILDKSLEKTRISFFSKINNLFTQKSKIDDLFLDNIENILISSDVGVNTTIKIIKKLENKKTNFFTKKDIYTTLYDIVYDILYLDNNKKLFKRIDNNPYIILVVGVNGAGKTTTIGKISYLLKNKGIKVIIGAADTFRAAATNQLSIWANKANVPLIEKKNNSHYSDPASVVFDTLKYAKANNIETVLIDTAGRLHNKINLMNELAKIKRVINKFINNNDNEEVMLIIDGSNGQNALEQTKKFINYTDVNSITVTKLDGSAKGGVLIGICDQYKIPIKYIGVGENIEDLQEFNINSFIKSFFKY